MPARRTAPASLTVVQYVAPAFSILNVLVPLLPEFSGLSTSYGTFTVAGAISLRSRLRGLGAYEDDADFEGNLQSKMQAEYNERVRFCDNKNSQLQLTAENMRLSILGKDSKTKDDKPLHVVEAYVKENTTELVDPLDVKKKLEVLEEKRSTLLTELDTQIKVSNATTFIELA